MVVYQQEPVPTLFLWICTVYLVVIQDRVGHGHASMLLDSIYLWSHLCFNRLLRCFQIVCDFIDSGYSLLYIHFYLFICYGLFD